MIASEHLEEDPFDELIKKDRPIIYQEEELKNIKFARILGWLYINDGKFNSARQWRKEFILFLKKTL